MLHYRWATTTAVYCVHPRRCHCLRRALLALPRLSSWDYRLLPCGFRAIFAFSTGDLKWLNLTIQPFAMRVLTLHWPDARHLLNEFVIITASVGYFLKYIWFGFRAGLFLIMLCCAHQCGSHLIISLIIAVNYTILALSCARNWFCYYRLPAANFLPIALGAFSLVRWPTLC